VSIANGTTDRAADYHRQRQADGRACLDAAIGYLARGLSVLSLCPPDHVGVGREHQCESPGKRPWHTWKPYQEKLPTEAEVRGWWRLKPNSNVGVALGPVSGLVRVDVEGEEGERRLAELSKGDLPPTWEFTSGKGRGLLYRIPEGVELRTTYEKPGEGQEVRFQAKGAQTVLPPSRHPSGRLYQWLPGRGPDDVDAAIMPDWLVGQLRADSRGGRNDKGSKRPLGEEDTVPKGGRNDHLISLAGAMRRRGASVHVIEAALVAENEERCQPPLGKEEVQGIARSAGRYRPFKGTATDSNSTPAANIIMAYWIERHDLTFKRGTKLYSSRLGQEVRAGELLVGASADLIERLAAASDAQRTEDGKAIHAKLPSLFRTWASSAWATLLENLPAEEESPEIAEDAESDFRRQVAAVLYSELPLGHEIKDGKETVCRVERRSLIDWCALFARPKKWGDIRGRQIWCMRGEDNRLRVALRLGLFGQVGNGTLAAMTPKRFAALAQRYGVATEEGLKLRQEDGKQCRGIELHPEFVAYLLARPEQPVEVARDGRDGWTG
jgi:hypothetical protein